jgi:NADH-quinone oxidoreductase subunit C
VSHLPAVAGNEGVAERALALLGEHVIDAAEAVGELTLLVQRDCIGLVLRTLRDTPDLAFEQLLDICGADYPDRDERFEVNYHLLSLRHNRRIRVKVTTDEEAPVPSVTSACSPVPDGMSARPGTVTVSISRETRICAAS